MSTVGIVLAAGAGTRMGRPKALVEDWLDRAAQVLTQGGCEPVIVVLGAQAADALPLVPAHTRAVVAEDWAEGMSASLRAGLGAAEQTDAAAALITLVDLPDLVPAVVARLLASEQSLARAAYDGHPGHPVLIARNHWGPISRIARGDHGARDYLATQTVSRVECGDLATGQDRDHSS